MQTSSPAAAALIESTEAAWDQRCTITWPGGVYPNMTTNIVSHNVDATLISDMPDGARAPVGYQNRSLKLTLGGRVDPLDETKDIFWLLNPLNAASPLYRVDVRGSAVTFDEGPYVPGSAVPEYFRQFTGQVDDITINDDGTVTVDCIDRMATLKSVVSVPAVVTVPPYNAGLTSEFARDYLLRNASDGAVSSWPARRPQCVLAVGMRGTIWPEVGALADSATIGGDQLIPSFGPGAFGTALTELTATFDTTSYGDLVYLLSSGDLGTHVFLEFWATGLTPSSLLFFSFTPAAISFNSLYLEVRSTGITVGVVGFSGNEYTWTTPIDGSAHYIAASIVVPPVGGTTSSATLYLDGASQASGTLTWGGPRDAVPINSLQLNVTTGATVEAVQVTTETSPARNNGFVPQAILDVSPNLLQVVPAVEGPLVDAFRLMDDAELAVSGFDENGLYRSTSRISRRGGMPVRTISSDSSLETATLELSGSGFANRIRATSAGWKFGTTSLVWTLASAMKVPANNAAHPLTFEVVIDDPTTLASQLDTSVVVMPDGYAGPAVSQYRASLDASGNGLHPGLNFTIQQLTPTTIRITIVNPTNQTAYLVSTAVTYTDMNPGTPLFHIAGIPITQGDAIIADAQWPPAIEGGAASSSRGEVPYTYSDNPWRQLPDPTQDLVDDTLCDLRRVKPVITNVSIVPDPRLQLGDRVQLVAPHLYINDPVAIFGIHGSSADGSSEMSLDVRMVASPGSWILGVPGRDELGVNIYV